MALTLSWNSPVISTYNKTTKLVTFSGSYTMNFVKGTANPNTCGYNDANKSIDFVLGTSSVACLDPTQVTPVFPQVNQFIWSTQYGSNTGDLVVNVAGTVGGIAYNNNCRGKNITFQANEYNSANSTNSGQWVFRGIICAGVLTICGTVTMAQPTWYVGSEPPLPPAATFTAANAYDGYDSVLLTVTSSSNYVDYWKFYRSTTSGGTYVEIATLYPSGSTTYYDHDVVTGNTYCYKLIASNELYDTTSAIHCLTVQTVTNSHCVIRNQATITNPTAGDTTSTYELWRSTAQTGTYQCVGHTPNAGTLIQDKITTFNQAYWYKPVQKTTYWSLTGASTQYTGTWAFSTTPVLTATLYSGSSRITLNWTDTAIYQQYYEIYKSIDGGAYSLLATVSGTTTYNDNTVTIDHEYFYKIRDKISCFAPTYVYSSYSNITDTIWAHPVIAPTSLMSSLITCTGITVSWINHNTTLQKVTGNTIQTYYGGAWHDFATVASGATTYRLTNLIPITTYQIRIKTASRLDAAYSSSISPQTLDPTPFSLNAVIADIYALTATITWSILDPPYGQSIRPEIRISGTTNWTQMPLIAHNATSYVFTYPTITFNTKYQVRIVRIGTEYPSAIIGFTTPLLPPDFCKISGYTVTNTTCGNLGTISLNEPAYLDFYNFVLTDYIGHTYTFNPITAIASVPAGYYKLQASCKPQYQYYYGYEDICITNFIPVYATNTTIFDVNVIIRNAISSFIIAAGGTNRYIALFKDTLSGHTYNYYLIKDDGSVSFSASTSNILGFLANPLQDGCYYGIIVNNYNNCTYLIPKNCTKPANWYNLSGVKQVFISAYNNTGTFGWDDWSTSDEDFYVQGIDPLTFVGTKIKRFYGTNPWYRLPTNQDTVYTCPWEKTRQGFMYTHTLTLNFAPSDYQRWVDLSETLKYTNRYLIVFEDNNGNWWTVGYSNVGARVYNYKHGSEVNQYEIVFKYYGFSMLTSLAEDYVKKYILT